MASVGGLIRDWLLKRNVLLSKPVGQFYIGHQRLQAACRRGLNIRCAVDGGAATGKWARSLKGIYPEAQILCIEPRDSAQQELHRLASDFPGIHVAKTLIGAAVGEAEFYVKDDMSSMLKFSSELKPQDVVREPVTTLDRLIEEMSLPAPDFIKLDLQGAELQALDGASGVLKAAQAVLLEVSFIPVNLGNPLVGDVIPYMKARGFQVYDVFALWQRPLDGALAQGDFLFLREGHSLLSESAWST